MAGFRAEIVWELFFSFHIVLFPCWLDVERSANPFKACAISSICFTLHLFKENCSTTVEKPHLTLEPAVSAKTCHLDARKKSYYGLEIEKCVDFQSLRQLSSTGCGFEANQREFLLRSKYWHDFRQRSKVIE
jgi:hypothetical protein